MPRSANGSFTQDMIGFAEKVIAYTQGLDQDSSVANGLNYEDK